jgi:hypothetical protein
MAIMTAQLKLLMKLKTLLTDNNIEYWLAYGTLLGAIREQNFLEHDTHDIDIGLNQKDYWKVRNLLESQDVLKIKRLWRTEIALYENDKAHIDLFFYTEKNNIMYSSAYLGNKAQSGINIESGMKFAKENIYPLKTVKFLKHKFTIPGKPESHLTENYGDWKTPDTKWSHTKLQSFDEDHRTIAILIPTFLRDERLMKSVDSILKRCDRDNTFRKWVRIYVADQGHKEWSETKTEFYKKLEKGGHKVYKTPFNSGLSYNRNYLVEKSVEPYVMIVDDDFEFTANTDLGAFLEILNHRENNGIVGGNIENRPPYHADLVFEEKERGRYLFRIQKLNEAQKVHVYNTTKKHKELIYFYTDIVLNFFLAKREVLEEIPLDNDLKLVEHTDHFLRIKQSNKWKVCHYPNTTCKHITSSVSKEYKSFRSNPEYTKMFLDKWGLKDEAHFIRVYEKNINDIACKEPDYKKIKVVQIARIPCANSGYELSKLLNAYSGKFESRYILGHGYSKKIGSIPYRAFPHDLFWEDEEAECIKAIQEADIVHIHHDSWKEIEPYLKGKRVISTVYNLTNSLQYKDSEFNRNYLDKLKSFGTVTVADQPLQKKMFNDISTTYVPLVKMLFGLNFIKKAESPITIGFSPTNHENVGIGSKRYDDVMNIIKKLKLRSDICFNFKLIEGLPYEENLQEKALCDILIDDVDDNYEKAHNTTIEAALLNAVPLTNYSGQWFPALKTDINSLESTLLDSILHPENIDDWRKNILKTWRIEVYTPQNLLQIYETLYKEELGEKNPIFKVVANKDPNINPQNSSIKEEFRLLDSYFQREKVEYCLIKTTCLDAVRFGELKIKPDELYLAVKDLKKASEIIKQLNLKLKVNICGSYPAQTKQIGFFGVARNIPFPSLPYLSNLYGSGQKWRVFGLDTED